MASRQLVRGLHRQKSLQISTTLLTSYHLKSFIVNVYWLRRLYEQRRTPVTTSTLSSADRPVGSPIEYQAPLHAPVGNGFASLRVQSAVASIYSLTASVTVLRDLSSLVPRPHLSRGKRSGEPSQISLLPECGKDQ